MSQWDVDTIASWSDVIHNLVIPLLCYFAYIGRDIRTELRKLNEKHQALQATQQELKQWSVDHDERDDRREQRLEHLERIAMRNGGAGL